MVKEKRILSYFLGWLIIGFCIIFVGVNNVLAEEIAYSNSTFRVKECGSNEWSNWTNATQKLSVYSINNLGFRLYFSNTQLTANTYYNITVTYNFYTETPSINVMNAYGKSTFYYNTTASESENIQGNNNNYSVRFEKDTENTNLIKAVYNVLIPVNSKFIAFNINWNEPNKDTCRMFSDGFTISNIKVESLNDTQAIVDGNNANTENIINNNNQNTQDIINNQNQNNEELKDTIKDQFNTCRDSYNLFNKNDIIYRNGYYINDNGEEITRNDLGYTENFIEVKSNTVYTISGTIVNENGYLRIYYYDNNKNFIGRTGPLNTPPQTFTTPNNTKYIRIQYQVGIINIDSIMLNEGSTVKEYEPYGEEICSNKIDETNDKLDNIEGALTDSTPTDMSGLNNSVGWLPPGPVDSLINLPFTLFNNLSISLSSECRDVVLTIPFLENNNRISLPCLKNIYEQIGITGTLFESAGLIAGVIILFNYLLDLYHWVDKTLTMRENTMPGYYDDNWGGGA